MPMSPRLLRPRATAALVAVDADARTYINAVRIADGGQYMEAGVQRAIDDFVIGCKADGIWTAIKASCILMGARTLSGALTPLVGTAPTNNGPFVSGDYDRETGLVGNGTTKYLDSNRPNNSDAQDDRHVALYAQAVPDTTSKTMMGCFVSPTGNWIANDASSLFFRANSGTSTTGAKVTGFLGISRASSSSVSVRRDGASATANVSSNGNPSIDTFVCARNTASGADQFSAARLAFYSIGSSVDLALLDSRVSTLYTAIGAAI